MKLFACDVCSQVVFFESVKCTRCGHVLAFLPDQMEMSAMEPAEGGEAPGGTGSGELRALTTGRRDGRYRLCKNSRDHEVCNWAVPVDDPLEYCRACRLNHMIPNLADATAKEAWHRIEIAKRRLLYTVFQLGLPVETKQENPEGGLAFDFLKEGATSKVFTGHSDGLITLNIAEADDPFREKMREQLGETYRTVLGHFRHESGHYYWERLIANRPELLTDCRRLFGDERESYEDARQRHYENGAPASWWERYVSAYATMHPWEDWAETWAHYLHMVDGIETARAYGLSLRPKPSGAPAGKAVNARRLDLHSFEDLLEGWVPLTLALNSMNRSFGMRDPYPFVLTAPAIEKLRFVHEVVAKG